MGKRLIPSTIIAAAAIVATASNAFATGVTITSATQTGSNLTVSGTATFTDQPFIVLGTDATGDTFAPGYGTLGGDTTDASMQTKANGDVVLRWRVTQMPQAPLNGSPTGVIYGWNFCVDGTSCYELYAGRQGVIWQTNLQPYGQLYSCDDPGCNGITFIRDDVPVSMTASTQSIIATLSQSWISASPGSVISPVAYSANGAAFTDLSDPSMFPLFYDFGDGVPDIADYSVARQQVSLAVGPSGQDPSAVTYATTVTPAGNGSYSGTLNVAGLTGSATIYVRACYGTGNCAYATQGIAFA